MIIDIINAWCYCGRNTVASLRLLPWLVQRSTFFPINQNTQLYLFFAFRSLRKSSAHKCDLNDSDLHFAQLLHCQLRPCRCSDLLGPSAVQRRRFGLNFGQLLACGSFIIISRGDSGMSTWAPLSIINLELPHWWGDTQTSYSGLECDP